MDILRAGSLFRRAIVCLFILAGLALFPADTHPASASSRAQASPAGEIAYGQGGQIWIIDVGSGQTRQLTSSFDKINGKPRWSPDGEWVAFWSVSVEDGNFDIYKVRADGSQLTQITFDSSVEVQPAYSSDGSLYFLRMDASRLQQAIGDGALDKMLAGIDYSIIKVDPSGQETIVHKEPGGPCGPADMSVAADGQITLSTFCLVPDFMHPVKMAVSLLDPQSGSYLDVGSRYIEADGCYSGGRQAHSNRRMALVELAGCDLLADSLMLRVLDLDSRDVRPVYSGDLDATVAPDWSPDDQWLGYVGGGGLWVISAQGGRPERLVSGDDIGSLAWRPAAISIQGDPTSVPPVVSKTYSISGRVLDVNGAPVPDVTVSDGKDHTATSDRDGKYTLSGLVPGDYRLEATKRDYTFGLYPPTEPAPSGGKDPTPTPGPRPTYTVHISDKNVGGHDFVGYDREPIVFVHGWNGFKGVVKGFFAQFWAMNCDWPEQVTDFWPSDKYLRDAGYMTYHVRLETTECSTPDYDSNAEILRNQIALVRAETHRDKVILIAHSMGGLVARAYIEGPYFERDQSPVSELFTFGTLHKGVRITNVTHGLPFALVCGQQPGFCNFTTSYMDQFNQNHKLRTSSVKYHMIGGVAPLSSRKFWGKVTWPTSLGNDGIVPIYSSIGKDLQGDVDRFKTDEVHSTDFGDFTYFNDRKGKPSHSYVQCLYWVLVKHNKTCSEKAELAEGQPEPGYSYSTRQSIDSLEAPLAEEEPQGAQSPFFNGTLASGQQANHTVIVGGGQAMFAVYWLTGTLSMTLVDPNGQRIDPSYAASHSGDISYETEPGSALYSFSKATAGAWHMEVRGENVPGQGAEYSAYAAFTSDLTLTTTTDREWYAPGATATISSTLTGGLSGSGAELTATLLRAGGGSDIVPLARQSDGHYQGTYTVPSASGYVEVRVTAKGTSASNSPFELGDLIAFQVQTASFALSGVYEANKEDCQEGASYRALQYAVGVKSANGGPVSLSADLVDEHGGQVAHSYVTGDVPAGGGNVVLRFDGEEIALSKLDGPFKLTNLLLASRGGTSLVADEAQNVATTSAFKYADFLCSVASKGPGTPVGGTDMSIVAILLFGGVALLGLGVLGLVLNRARKRAVQNVSVQPGMYQYPMQYPGATQSLPLVRPSAPVQPTSVMSQFPPPSSNQAPTQVYGTYSAPSAPGAPGVPGVPPTYNSRPPLPNYPPPPFPSRPAPPLPRTPVGMNPPSSNYPAAHPNMKPAIQPPPLRAITPPAQPGQGAGTPNAPGMGASTPLPPPPPPPRPQAQPSGQSGVLCANCGRVLNAQSRQCDSCGWKAP